VETRTNGNGKGTYRLGPSEDARLDALKAKLGQGSRSDVLRAAIRLLEDELDKGQERIGGLIRRLDQFIPAFDPAVVDASGFDLRRDQAWARVGDVTYADQPLTWIFAERISDDGTLERTKVEPDGENADKRMWIGPAHWEA